MDVGNSVIYPYHGAGRIIDREEIEHDGETTNYLVIEICLNQKTIKVPEDNLQTVGIRQLTPKERFYELLEEAKEFIESSYDHEEGKHPEKIHQQTLKALLAEVKSGDIDASIEGLKKLHTRFLDQELNITEKRVYDTVQQFIKGEIMCIEGCCAIEAGKKFSRLFPDDLDELIEEPADEEPAETKE